MTILYKRYLRPSSVQLEDNGSGGEDRWMVHCDAIHTRDEIIDWFMAQEDAPIPGISVVLMNGRYAICKQVSAQMHPRSRYRWIVTALFQPPQTSGGSSQPVTQPSPLGTTDEPDPDIKPDDPDTWDPVIMRRTVRQSKEMTKAFYQGGYIGTAHSALSAFTSADPSQRACFVNSAMMPFTNAPQVVDIGGLWIFRFVSRDAPNITTLKALENTLNSNVCAIIHRDLNFTWPIKTARCESIELGETRVNNEHAWEIEIQIQERYDGWVIEVADRGFEVRAWPSVDVDENAITISDATSRRRAIKDGPTGQRPSKPCPLNGDGAELAPGYNEVYGRWIYERQVNWATFPYLSDLFF